MGIDDSVIPFLLILGLIICVYILVKRGEKVQEHLPPKRQILIGTHRLSGKLVYVNEEEFWEKHIEILGIPGVGKSSFLEYLIRTFILLGLGLCLIDPDGDLYHALLAFVVKHHLEDRVVLIDPNDREWAVGLNVLEYDEETSAVTPHTEEVMDELKLVLGEPIGDFKPQHERWERDALSLLVEQRLTIVELMQFGDIDEPVLRKRLLQATKLDAEIIDEWRRFDKDTSTHDQRTYIASLLNRAAHFATGDVKLIFGQEKSTVDFRKAMDEGKIILVNLNAQRISAKARRMIGVEILYKIWRAARSRGDIPRDQRRPFHVFVDEFGSMVSEQMADSLDTLRKFGVHYFLSHQRLGQLKKQSENLSSAVIADTALKFIFSTSVEDARIIVPEIFSGMIRGDKVKLTLTHRAFAPRQEWVEIRSRSQGRVSGGGRARISGGGSGGATSSGLAHSLKVGEGVFEVPVEMGRVESAADTSGWQEHHAESESSLWSSIETESVSEAPITVHDEYEEVSSVQFYSIEEMKEKFTAWIANQGKREMQFSKKGRRPIPLITPTVEEITVSQEEVERFKQIVYARCALPAEEAVRQLEARRQKLLIASEEEKIALGILPPVSRKMSRTKVTAMKAVDAEEVADESNPHE